jgi:hypothetical protein
MTLNEKQHQIWRSVIISLLKIAKSLQTELCAVANLEEGLKERKVSAVPNERFMEE